MHKLIDPAPASLPPQRGSGTHRVRGFTLIELMVVVVIITLMAAIALPGINRRMKSYRAKATAEEIATIYRTARLRAMGRGSAVLVRYDDSAGTFEIREAIQGADASDGINGQCATLPETSCVTNPNRWNTNNKSQELSKTYFDVNEYDITAVFLKPSSTSTTITGRSSLDICYTPMGQPYADMDTAGTLLRMTTAPRFDVARADTVGISRSVLINTVGPARVVADE